jgi:hypothetical protein
MDTVKTLMLAGLTLGVGSAMACGSDVTNDYAAKLLAAHQSESGQVQSGSSDVDAQEDAFQLGPFHATSPRSNRPVGGQGGG